MKIKKFIQKIPEVLCSIQNDKGKVRSNELNTVNSCIVETNHRNKMTDSKINLVSVCLCFLEKIGILFLLF